MTACAHCGRPIEQDDAPDGPWFHPDTMHARCDGPDDEPGLAWGDMVRQAEPAGINAASLLLWLDDAVDQIDNGETAEALTLLAMARDALRDLIEDDQEVTA